MFKNREGYLTQPKERVSYWSYFVGQNIVYNLVNGFLATYLMFLGIPLISSAAVMLVVKVWDAVNDVLFGVLFDKIKFKGKEKAMPWIRISSPIIAATTILLFAIPNSIGPNQKLLWLAAAYLLWDSAFTLCDIPAYALVTTMTNNLDERNVLMSGRSITGGIGSGITIIITTVFLSGKVGIGWFPIAILCSFLALLFMLPLSFMGKEHVYDAKIDKEKSFTIKEMLSYVVHNKYLLIFYAGFLVGQAFQTTNALNLFVAYYIFDDSLFALISVIAFAAGGFLVSAILPKMLRKVDKFKMYFFSLIATVIIGIITYFIGDKSPALFIVVSVLRAIPFSVIGVLRFMFTPDHAEYGQYKTGIEAKGITFAVQTFAAKAQGALSSASALFILGLPVFNWITIEATDFAALKAQGIIQPPEAIDGLWFTYALIPTIALAVSIIPYLFYNLTDKDVEIMTECNAGEITRTEAEARLSRKY